MSDERPNPGLRRRRQPRKATAGYLERAALYYLQRHSATAAMLRRVLARRVARSARAHGTDLAEGRAMIEALLARLMRAGLIDDQRFARLKADALVRRGTSPRAIAARLKARGVSTDQIRGAIAALAEQSEDPELDAAMALARRRRLGPFGKDRAGERQRRDLAAMVRAGFSFRVARKVLGPATVR